MSIWILIKCFFESVKMAPQKSAWKPVPSAKTWPKLAPPKTRSRTKATKPKTSNICQTVPIDFPEAITESQAVVAQPTLDPKPLNSNPKPLEPLIPVLLLLDVKFEKEPVLQGPDHCDIIDGSLYVEQQSAWGTKVGFQLEWFERSDQLVPILMLELQLLWLRTRLWSKQGLLGSADWL